MSFSGDLLYYWTFQDIDATYDYKIEIYKASYSGASTEITSGAILPPMVDIYRGSKSNLFQIIYPREIEFGFYVDKDNLATYDPLLEATYKQYLVKAYRDATQIFTGYLNPEDNNRQLTGKKYEYRMTASDLILDLKDTDYLDYSVLTTGLPYTDTTNILTVLKRCLAFTGVEIDFYVQLNTYETVTSATTECALEQMTVDNRRFSKDNDGEIRAWKCSTVIDELLRPFHCNLAQVNNKWQIVNYQEYNSKYYEYDWATLTLQNAPNTARNLSASIETVNTKFVGKPFLYKISPIGKLRVKYLNINIGESEILNGDFSSGLTGWNNGTGTEEWPNFADGGGYLRTQIVGPAAAFSGDKVFYRDSFTIADFTEGDVFSIQWKCKLVEVTLTGGAPDIYNPYVACAIKYPDGNILVDVFQASTAEGANYTLYNNIGPLPINATGTYNLYFYVRTSLDATVDSMDYNWDDVVITGIKQGTLRTTDTLYIYDSDIDSKREEEFEIYFSDAGRATDIGRLIDDSTLSSSWSRYGKGETLSLVKTYAQQILNNFGAYKNYIKGTIFDIGDNLHFFSVPIYDSEYYRFINYRKDFRARQIEFEFDEILNTDVGYSQLVQNLTSIDGKSTNTATVNVYSIAGGSLWVASGSNIYYSAGKVTVGAASPAGNVGKFQVVGATQAPTDYGSLFELSLGTGIYTDEKLAFGINGTGARWIQGVKAGTGFRALSLNPGGGAVNINGGGSIVTALTASRALVTGASSELAVSATTATELGYVNGVTSAIQTQFTGKISHSLSTAANDILVGSGTDTFIKKTQAEGKVLLNYWTLATADIYYTAGNVAIGTSTFSEKLTVDGNIRMTNNGQLGVTTGFLLAYSANNSVYIRSSTSSGSGQKIYLNDDNTDDVSIAAGGGSIITALTASRALVTSAGSALAVSATTATELGYVNGVTSAIQTQIDGKISHSLATAASDFLVASGSGAYVKKTLAETKTILGLDSAEWTPTATGVTNVDSINTVYGASYIRVGSFVICSGYIDVNPTTAGNVTEMRITLPVASSFTDSYDCFGSGNVYGLTTMGSVHILGESTNDEALFRWYAQTNSTDSVRFMFMYRII